MWSVYNPTSDEETITADCDEHNSAEHIVLSSKCEEPTSRDNNNDVDSAAKILPKTLQASRDSPKLEPFRGHRRGIRKVPDFVRRAEP